ncbi:unnamed protein product [Prunus brigantina]
MSEFLTGEGIIHETSCVGTPQQNGVAKRKNRDLLEKTRSLMFQMNVPKRFWSQAVVTAAYLINRLPSQAFFKEKSGADSQRESPFDQVPLPIVDTTEGCYPSNTDGDGADSRNSLSHNLTGDNDISPQNEESVFNGEHSHAINDSIISSNGTLRRSCRIKNKPPSAKPTENPVNSKEKLSLDGELLSDVGQYQRLVGKLTYLTITRPDITYAVSLVSQFMHAPRTSHLTAVNRILRY